MAVTRNRVFGTTLIVAFQCLTLFGAAVPVSATPAPVLASEVQAQQDQGLVAFLRAGNLWLMNGDGTDQRAVTAYDDPVRDYSWSPSGRYLLIQRGGRRVVGTDVVQTDEVSDLYEVTTGEIREIARSAQSTKSIASANPPVWALDADKLLWATLSQNTYTLAQIELDGASTWLASFEQPDICGGPDGPFATMYGLAWEQGGGPWGRNTYEPVIWSDAGRIAWVRTACGNDRTVDLTNGVSQEIDYQPYAAAGGTMLIRGDAVSSNGLQLLDLMTGNRMPLPEGGDFVFGPDGVLFFTRVVRGQESNFVSRFDSFAMGLTDNTVELWRTDVQASEPALIASMLAFATGLPRPIADGTAIVFGMVDNPSELIGIDESEVEQFTPELYADHLKAVRVDIASGEVSVLSDDAILPKPQPGAVQSPATPDTKTPAVEPNATPTLPPTGEAGDGWIAYAGNDGNIWLTRHDGSESLQVTSDGSPDRPYLHPAWSPDGTMLVFSTRNGEAENGNDIYLLRGGMVTRVPAIHNCNDAAFTPDGAHLALLCAAYRGGGGVPTQQELDSTPADGFVSIVDLDGSNWRVLAPFQTQLDGMDSLWWTMLSTYDLSVSPIDGELLVNTIFWSSARYRQIHLIGSNGAWDARFGMPENDAGRVWGSFAVDGTHVLARLCRGCYKDSSGPADTSIVLLDRDGNLVETLYTPDANVVIGSFAQSPDGQYLLVSSTTEESDLDFGTSGLTYTTQLVDLPSGAVTSVSIDGNGFAWQPVAAEIDVPDGVGGSPPPAVGTMHPPIVAITCSVYADQFGSSYGIGLDLPEGCAFAPGASFTVSDANGNVYGTCIADDSGYCQGGALVPVDVGVVVTQDGATIPDGYVVAGGNPQTLIYPHEAIGTEGPQWLFVTMPAGVAEGQPATSGAPVIEAGSDWIAYTGKDGNLWLMQPDGGNQTQITFDGSPDAAYGAASWSHDGTMLVFARVPASPADMSQVYLLANGGVAPIPGIYGCDSAAFLPGDQQIAMTCGRDGDENASQATLQIDPSLGLISIANLDGSDWHVQVPYNQADTNIWPTLGIGPGATTAGGVSVAPDGTIYFDYSTQMGGGMASALADSSTVERMGSSLESGSAGGVYVDAAGSFLVAACRGCYVQSHEDLQFTIDWMDRDGTLTANVLTPDPTLRIGPPTISPDGGTLVYPIADGGYPFYGAIQSRDLGSGVETTIAQGWGPAWQPNPAVAMQLPASADPGPPTAVATEAAETPLPDETGATVPDQYIRGWTGTGVQENPHGEWPLDIVISGGGIGEVVGYSGYPEQSCGGELILQDVQADAIVLHEQLTYGQTACSDGGTVTLSGVVLNTVQFTWNGIGPNGTPSSASGTLGYPDQAALHGDSSATGDAPQASGAALEEPFVGTTWTGTGYQESPANTWPVTITLTGGNEGEVVGTIDYPTLGCGGEIILTEVNTEDDFGSFWAQEHITYGQDNCIDGGRFLFHLSEGAFLLNFEWTSPSGPTTATGQLEPS